MAYPASHDRPHDVSVVLNYDLNPQWKVSSIFVYSSGTTFTPIRSIYLVEQNINYLFGDRNSARVEPYHRLDVSATLTPEQLEDKPFTYSWTFSIYNLYDRRNPLFSYYSPEQDENTGKVHVVARRVSFFPVIPSVTWNFKWKQRKQEDEKPDLEIIN
ncbi:MAG: TonB-dependent receptor [Saprospiraceae bacterium]|nr:TonB-dependent receptor [Saprospiraceae bacterium]